MAIHRSRIQSLRARGFRIEVVAEEALQGHERERGEGIADFLDTLAPRELEYLQRALMGVRGCHGRELDRYYQRISSGLEWTVIRWGCAVRDMLVRVILCKGAKTANNT